MSSKIETGGRRGWTVALAATVGVAALLRVAGLQNGLWYDEIVTLVLSARLPFDRIVTEFPGVNVHPLYSLAAHGAMVVFGESAWALRLPACLFGIGTVWLVYVLGVRLVSHVEAWAASAVLATSYHHIWFSQNARGYTLMAFLTLASTLLLLRALHSGRPREFVWYAVACAAGVYTHLTMAFVVAGHAAVVLIAAVAGGRVVAEGRVARLVAAWAGAAALSVVLYLPYLPSLMAVMIGDEAPRAVAQVATASWALGEAVRSLVSGAGVPAALAAGLFAVVGGLSLLRQRPFEIALLLAPAFVTLGAIVALGQPLRPRFFFFLCGAGAIFVGRGLVLVLRRILPSPLTARPAGLAAGAVAVTLTLVAVSLPALARNYELPKQDFDRTVAYLDEAAATGVVVAAAGPACLPIDLYYRRPWSCVETVDDWTTLVAAGGRTVIVHTLTDYVDDAGVRQRLRSQCAELRRFEGTLGGGDLVVCEVGP